VPPKLDVAPRMSGRERVLISNMWGFRCRRVCCWCGADDTSGGRPRSAYSRKAVVMASPKSQSASPI